MTKDEIIKGIVKILEEESEEFGGFYVRDISFDRIGGRTLINFGSDHFQCDKPLTLEEILYVYLEGCNRFLEMKGVSEKVIIDINNSGMPQAILATIH